MTSDFKALFEVQGKEEEEEEEGVPQSTYVPGVCYTRLLNHLQPDSLPGKHRKIYRILSQKITFIWLCLS